MAKFRLIQATKLDVCFCRVPLFNYVAHYYLIHSLSVLNLLLSGVSWSAIDFQNGTGGISPGDGVSLSMTYLIWLLLVVSLYPLCNWYQGFKSKQTDSTQFGVITRADGKKQNTFKGWPLYRFAQDTKPGDVTGRQRAVSTWQSQSIRS